MSKENFDYAKIDFHNLIDQHNHRLINFGKDNELIYKPENFKKDAIKNNIYIILTIKDKEKTLEILEEEINELYDKLSERKEDDWKNELLQKSQTVDDIRELEPYTIMKQMEELM
ncbi:MAG: hypothetical protein LBP53_05405 [Candidatus Peribacteria bacterium]|jgi:predicted Zn-dependent peptidase|nr:hypothetical protein [Candidatus Peribacteria bacterium]